MGKIAFINRNLISEVKELHKSDLCRVPVVGETIVLTINGEEKSCIIDEVTHWLEKKDVICTYTR